MLEELGDLSQLSVYGLTHYLKELTALTQRVEHLAGAKAPRAEDQALLDKKEELLDAAGRLRRTLGGLLEKPSLTKREKPLAEAFLQEQLTKLSAQGSDERTAKGVERLRQLLTSVKISDPVPESRSVQEIEATLKKLDAEWKEVSPIYEKWQAGKHSFKSNPELQAFRRRYEDCRKGRESFSEKLQKALLAARVAAAPAVAETRPTGWSTAAKKAVEKQAPVSVMRGDAVRGPMAVALDRQKASPKSRATWGSSVMSLAQRLRAEIAHSVREAPEPQEAEDEGFWEAAPAPSCPSPSSAEAPKAVATRRWDRSHPPPPPPAEAEDEEEEPVVPQTDLPKSDARPSFAVSAKKKGKAKKKRGSAEEEDIDELPAQTKGPLATSAAASWVAGVKTALVGSLLEDLLTREAWQPQSTEVAEERLQELAHRLIWLSPVGLPLPLEWAAFASLEVDGGPERSSKRGTPQWLKRLQKNVPWLLPHYLTIIFVVTLLHSLSHFGLLALASLLQVALVLAPPNVGGLQPPARLLLLQVLHLVLWLCFARSLWLMHVLIKGLLLLLVAGHAYTVADTRGS